MAAHQAPPSLGFSRQEHWRGLPFPTPGDLPNPGIEPASPVSPALQADILPLNHQGSPMLLLSHLSRVQLCATPHTADHQAPLSLGFSRQEHWSGLPFPSPMPESEKWKWSRSVVSDPQRPYGLQPPRLLCPWDFPGKSTGVGCHCLLQGSPISVSNYFSGRCHSFNVYSRQIMLIKSMFIWFQ